MDSAVLFSIPTTTTHGYCWRWRSADGKVDSQRRFDYYYDCVADAEAHGYPVMPPDVNGENAPGRAALPISFRS